MNPLKWKLHWQILTALIFALIVGIGMRSFGSADGEAGMKVAAGCEFLGKLFMNALKMVVVPLIVSSIICGIMGLGSDRNFGRMGVKILIYYSLTGITAIVLGLVLVNLIRPGVVEPETVQLILGQQEKSGDFTARFEGRGSGEIMEIFLRMLPPNIVKAATDNGQLLGMICFSLLFGYFISRLPERLQEFQRDLWESVKEVMMMITNIVIRFAPIGVFGLVTPIIMRTGFEVFVPLSWFVLTVALALGLHLFVTLGLLLKFVAKVSPWQHFRTMAPVLLTAFSTASSASTLPVTLDVVERDAGVSNRTASFTLPLGATVNMDGTALYECVVVIFIAQFYGVLEGFEIGFVTQFTVVLLALMTSVGVAGIPSASLVAITVILGVVGIDPSAVGLVWVTDRILDMCRTAVNVYSDTCGAVIIGRTEGEETIYPAVSSEDGSERKEA
jgi:proton glutamate symport protein